MCLPHRSSRRVVASVDVWWGDACRLLRNKLKSHQPVELLFLDGLPSQYLDYLHAAEHSLAPGALVIADNAGIFAEGGLRTYLEYVRNSSSYSSRFHRVTVGVGADCC